MMLRIDGWTYPVWAGVRPSCDTAGMRAMGVQAMMGEQATGATVPRTQADVLRAIRGMGLYATVRDGEYRIAPPTPDRKARERMAYYTDDARDAVLTARWIAREWAKQEGA